MDRVEDVDVIVNAITRRTAKGRTGSAQNNTRAESMQEKVKPMTDDAAEPQSSAASPRPARRRPFAPKSSKAVAKPLVRPARLRRKGDHVWKDKSYMPLPEESPDDHEDETDLVADARDAILQGRLTANGEPSPSPDEVPDQVLRLH